MFPSRFGPRFPAVTPAYDKDLQKLLRETSDKLGFKDSTRFGVYCNVGGPTYETIAELNMLSKLGADSVGELNFLNIKRRMIV